MDGIIVCPNAQGCSSSVSPTVAVLLPVRLLPRLFFLGRTWSSPSLPCWPSSSPPFSLSLSEGSPDVLWIFRFFPLSFLIARSRRTISLFLIFSRYLSSSSLHCLGV